MFQFQNGCSNFVVFATSLFLHALCLLLFLPPRGQSLLLQGINAFRYNTAKNIYGTYEDDSVWPKKASVLLTPRFTSYLPNSAPANFGHTVALSNNWMLISSCIHCSTNPPYSNENWVFLFKKEGDDHSGDWIPQTIWSTKLPGLEDNKRFGEVVALTDSWVLLSDYMADTVLICATHGCRTDVASRYVFSIPDSYSCSPVLCSFGMSVALSTDNNFAVVAAPGIKRVFIYKNEGGALSSVSNEGETWNTVPVATLTTGDTDTSTGFGSQIALTDNWLLVGFGIKSSVMEHTFSVTGISKDQLNTPTKIQEIVDAIATYLDVPSSTVTISDIQPSSITDGVGVDLRYKVVNFDSANGVGGWFVTKVVNQMKNMNANKLTLVAGLDSANGAVEKWYQKVGYSGAFCGTKNNYAGRGTTFASCENYCISEPSCAGVGFRGTTGYVDTTGIICRLCPATGEHSVSKPTVTSLDPMLPFPYPGKWGVYTWSGGTAGKPTSSYAVTTTQKLLGAMASSAGVPVANVALASTSVPTRASAVRKAFLFKNNNGTWSNTPDFVFDQDMGLENVPNGFGLALALTDNWALVADPKGKKISMFKNTGGIWATTAAAILSEPDYWNFGLKVALTDNFALVSGTQDATLYRYNNELHARRNSVTQDVILYEKNEAGEWTKKQSWTDDYPCYSCDIKTSSGTRYTNGGPYFGNSIALTEKYAVVGSPGSNWPYGDKVYVYQNAKSLQQRCDTFSASDCSERGLDLIAAPEDKTCAKYSFDDMFILTAGDSGNGANTGATCGVPKAHLRGITFEACKRACIYHHEEYMKNSNGYPSDCAGIGYRAKPPTSCSICEATGEKSVATPILPGATHSTADLNWCGVYTRIPGDCVASECCVERIITCDTFSASDCPKNTLIRENLPEIICGYGYDTCVASDCCAVKPNTCDTFSAVGCPDDSLLRTNLPDVICGYGDDIFNLTAGVDSGNGVNPHYPNPERGLYSRLDLLKFYSEPSAFCEGVESNEDFESCKNSCITNAATCAGISFRGSPCVGPQLGTSIVFDLKKKDHTDQDAVSFDDLKHFINEVGLVTQGATARGTLTHVHTSTVWEEDGSIIAVVTVAITVTAGTFDAEDHTALGQNLKFRSTKFISAMNGGDGGTFINIRFDKILALEVVPITGAACFRCRQCEATGENSVETPGLVDTPSFFLPASSVYSTEPPHKLWGVYTLVRNNCTHNQCCVEQPTCDDIDGLGTTFPSCIQGAKHLKSDLASIKCVTAECAASECCDDNPTCMDIDGADTTFAAESCLLNTNWLMNNFSTVVCASETCVATDCCTTECLPLVEEASLEVRVSSTLNFDGVEILGDNSTDTEIESSAYIQYRFVWERMPCGSTVNVLGLAFGDSVLEELPLLKNKHLSAKYDKNLVEPFDFFDGTEFVCQNVATGECNIVINAESIAPQVGEESMEFALELNYESALEGSDDSSDGGRRRLLRSRKIRKSVKVKPLADADGDGISNVAEGAGNEEDTPTDTDLDLTPDYLDTDSDNDGEPDATDPYPSDIATCDNMDGNNTDFASSSCIAGTNHLKDTLVGLTCATGGVCVAADCCDPNPTCNSFDGCAEGTHLIEIPESVTCAIGACTKAECCDPNPTCANITGNNTGFASTSCVARTNHLKDTLVGITCLTDICGATDCCNPNPTCTGFVGCVDGTNHLVEIPESVTCATDTCAKADCCDPNPMCDNVEGNNTDFASSSCVAGINHLKVSLAGIKCSTGICGATDCCDPNPTCTGFVDCVEGTNYLMESPEAVICAMGTCTNAECCVTNPTCDNVDRQGTAFVAASCVTNTNYLMNDLSGTCATQTCAATDCCTVECYPPSQVAALEVRVSTTTDFTGVEAIEDDDYEIESADFVQYRFVWNSQPCGSTVNVIDIAFGPSDQEELPLLKEEHRSATYENKLVEPPDFFDGAELVCTNVASRECNIVVNAESIAPDVGEEGKEFTLDLGYESALEGTDGRPSRRIRKTIKVKPLSDSDGDGVSDVAEGAGNKVDTPTDTDGDFTPDYLDIDSDNDNVPDSMESKQGRTDPNSDTDNDGLLDREEGTGDSDNDGLRDFQDRDSDNDGVLDQNETLSASKDAASDKDGDGKLDRDEGTDDIDLDGIPNYQDLDSDGDGYLDQEETDEAYKDVSIYTPQSSIVNYNMKVNTFDELFELRNKLSSATWPKLKAVIATDGDVNRYFRINKVSMQIRMQHFEVTHCFVLGGEQLRIANFLFVSAQSEMAQSIHTTHNFSNLTAGDSSVRLTSIQNVGESSGVQSYRFGYSISVQSMEDLHRVYSYLTALDEEKSTNLYWAHVRQTAAKFTNTSKSSIRFRRCVIAHYYQPLMAIQVQVKIFGNGVTPNTLVNIDSGSIMGAVKSDAQLTTVTMTETMHTAGAIVVLSLPVSPSPLSSSHSFQTKNDAKDDSSPSPSPLDGKGKIMTDELSINNSSSSQPWQESSIVLMAINSTFVCCFLSCCFYWFCCAKKKEKHSKQQPMWYLYKKWGKTIAHKRQGDQLSLSKVVPKSAVASLPAIDALDLSALVLPDFKPNLDLDLDLNSSMDMNSLNLTSLELLPNFNDGIDLSSLTLDDTGGEDAVFSDLDSLSFEQKMMLLSS